MNERTGKGARVGRKVVRVADGIIGIVVLCVLLFVLAYGCYAIWDSNQIHKAASANAYEIYKPSAKNPESIDKLKAINPETVGWINIYGTGIDYPIVQAEDNVKYLNTSAEGNYSLAGSIFLDCDSAPDFSDFCSLIHGHNMAENAMFGQVSDFASGDFFNDHKYGSLFYDGTEYGLYIIEYLQADAYDTDLYGKTPRTDAEKRAYYNMLADKALQRREKEASTSGRYALLSTCSTGFTNARDLLLVKICDEAFEDPFAHDKESGQQLTDDTSSKGHIPLWIVAAAVTIALIVLKRLLDKRVKKDKETIAGKELDKSK